MGAAASATAQDATQSPRAPRELQPPMPEAVNGAQHACREQSESAAAAIAAWMAEISNALPAVDQAAVEIKRRDTYDKFMCSHLLRHTSFASTAISLRAATAFAGSAASARKAICDSRTSNGSPDRGLSTPSPADGASYPSREDKISSGLHLMAQRLSFLNLEIVEMMDDGNCQFRAIAYELYGNQHCHPQVREATVAYLKQNSDRFSVYVGDDADWKDYIKTMSAARTWGDELTLTAASEVYGVAINVVSTEAVNWLLRYDRGPQLQQDPRRELFLAYISPIHYNVIKPRQKNC